MSEAIAVVERAERLPDRHRLVCRFASLPMEPVAPAGLYGAAPDEAAVFPLHRAVGRDGDRITFETFGLDLLLPPEGSRHRYRAWWMPHAMAAAMDRETTWCRRRFPTYQDHEHCLFTWETISAQAGYTNHGYWSERHGGVVEQAWRDFVEGDIYRLRADDPELLARETAFRRVRGLLMEQWDPIGVNGMPEAADEYDAYVRHVTGMIRDGAPADAIAGHLWRIETVHMGLRGDRRRVAAVARQLAADPRGESP